MKSVLNYLETSRIRFQRGSCSPSVGFDAHYSTADLSKIVQTLGDERSIYANIDYDIAGRYVRVGCSSARFTDS